ncbi:unnamed protein product [Vicia faba]|uniref:C3H1-type domain-containing protein n=1 Tax=Vicia faba TaxID=3906 RepID=A0AAV1ANI0_VICFA|nr:unnamed protein product [Vicia faba]
MEEKYTEFSQHLKKPRISEETNSKIKTELCRRFMQGLCVHGSKCNFAHGFSELRTAPKLCRMFLYNRQCTYGHACRYLHSSVPLQHHHDHGHHHSRFNVSSAAKPELGTVQNAKQGTKENAGSMIMQTSAAAAATTGAHSSAQNNIMATSSSTPATNASASPAVATTSFHKNGPYACKTIFDEKKLQRVSRIYGDWI